MEDIYFLIFVIIGFSGFFINNKWLYYIQVIYLYILVAFNNGGPDYNGYQALFDIFKKSIAHEIKGGVLYRNLIYYFSKLGISLEGSIIILSSIVFYIFLYIFRKTKCKNRTFVLSCIYFFPSIDYIIQKRNLYAMSSLLLGFFLYSKKSKLKALACIIVSFLLHTSFIFYFIVYILMGFKIKRIKIINFILFSIFFVIFPFILNILKDIGFLSEEMIFLYSRDLTNRLALIKVVFFIILHLCMFFLVSYSYKKTVNKTYFDYIIYKLNLILLCVIPFYYYNSTFFRLYRNIYFLNYIFLIRKNEKRSKIKWLIIGYTIFLNLVMYIIFGQLKYKGLVRPLFEYNSIFQLIR